VNAPLENKRHSVRKQAAFKTNVDSGEAAFEGRCSPAGSSRRRVIRFALASSALLAASASTAVFR